MDTDVWSAGFRARVENPPHRLVPVLDFTRGFEDEDKKENEEDCAFRCLSRKLVGPLRCPGGRKLRKKLVSCYHADAKAACQRRSFRFRCSLYPCLSVFIRG